MNTHFKSALNKIKAEDELFEKTEKYLRAQLENPNQGKTLSFRRNAKQMKKLVVSIAAVFVFAFLGVYRYLKTPVAYISLDINPSVELGVNALNNVVTVEGVNKDGQAILEGQDLINADITDAVNQLIDSAAEKDYIKDDGTSIISITAESNDENKAEELTNICEQAVNGSMNKNEVTALIYKDCSDLSLRTEAKKLGISPGKFKLIKTVQALDPSITIDQLKDAKVSDIMLKAKELIATIDAETSDSELNESQKEIIENLKDVAQKKDKSVKDAAKAQFKATKEQAKATFEEAKKQAKAIKEDAKIKAKELRMQANALLKNTDDMTEAEKAAVKAKAEELRKQADTLMKEADKQAEELKDAAEKQKDAAIEAAEKIKDAAESKNEDKEKDKKDIKDKDNDNKHKNGKGKGLKNREDDKDDSDKDCIEIEIGDGNDKKDNEQN